MARFTTRVELHSASTVEDYDTLHEQMEARGFTRTIENSEGVTYHLPWAEYNCVVDNPIAEVLAAAEAAAAATGKKYAVLVTEATRRRWSGLKRAN